MPPYYFCQAKGQLLRRTCADYSGHLSVADRRKECNGKVILTPLDWRRMAQVSEQSKKAPQTLL